MNSIKCNNCGLTNFAQETECRRCGYSFVTVNKGVEVRPRRFSIWSLLFVAGAVGLFYYFYTGIPVNVDNVNANLANRVVSQQSPSPGLSRTQADQQRSGHYGTAMRNSAELKAHENRTRQTEKTVQELTNSK